LLCVDQIRVTLQNRFDLLAPRQDPRDRESSGNCETAEMGRQSFRSRLGNLFSERKGGAKGSAADAFVRGCGQVKLTWEFSEEALIDSGKFTKE